MFREIDSLKPLIEDENQRGQLERVKELLDKKVDNIRELRALKRSDETDVSLEKAIAQIAKIESNSDKLEIQDFADPDHLQDYQKNVIRTWSTFEREYS